MAYNDTFQRGSVPTYSDTSLAPLLTVDEQKEIIQGAVEKSAVARFMKQAKMGSGVTRMRAIDTLPTAYFVNGDTGLKQTTTMAWKNVWLYAEEIAVIVPVPEAVLADLDYDLWGQVRPKIEEAFGVALDAAILFGTNKPSSWPTAVVTAAIAAGNTVTQGTGVDVASDLSNAMAAVEADGYGVNAIVHRQDLRGSMRNLRDTTNAPIFLANDPGISNTSYGSGMDARDGRIWNTPSRALMNGTFEAHDAATANAAKAIAAEWDQFIFATRQDITSKISGEAIIQDGNGDIQYNLFQQDMVAMRFVGRFAFAVPNPVNRTNSVTATRYPAAVLRDAS